MNKKFKETTIPEDVSKILASQTLLLGPAHIDKLATVVFHAVSSCLSDIKDEKTPKAVVFKTVDGTFIGAAKVEYMANKDDPKNPSAGRWDYTWTFYEEDINGADIVDVSTNALMTKYFSSSGSNLYGMTFISSDVCVTLCTLVIEMIKKWLVDNTTSSDPEATLTLEGVFTASGAIIDGKIELGVVPAGEMKVIIKDDAKIQEK